MGEEPVCRVLAIMGSGETSPTMVTAHKALAARLGPGVPRAVLLDTPYAFQENAADISARAQEYFARSVGLKVDVVDVVTPDEAGPAIRTADWVFCGPGSPTYALRRWRAGPVPRAFRDRIAAGSGITVIASAAAAAIGLFAIPVYEIYKVGADPYWLDGLDLLSVIGLRVAVIPHYDNAEGGTHDTRFCYLGERRLAQLEPELPADAAVLGVDEHTALIFDLAAQVAEVVGRGGVTVRKAGVSKVLPNGSKLTLDELRTLVRTGAASVGSAETRTSANRLPSSTDPDQSEPAPRLLPDAIKHATVQFDASVADRDSAGLVTAILDLDASVEAWATDTDENDDADQARAVLRGLIGRLGKIADDGLITPADRLRPAVEPLVALRERLRRGGDYAAADEIRDALGTAGVVVQDTADGVRWQISQ